MLRIAVLALGLVAGAGSASAQDLGAQEILPDRFTHILRDVDLPGSDLRPILDTTLTGCEAACRADPDCAAFTFNGRNGTCFPKTAAGEVVAYAGAFSGLLQPTDPEVLARAADRRDALAFLSREDIAAAFAQAGGLALVHQGDGLGAAEWRRAAEAAFAEGNAAGAVRMMGVAVTRSDLAADWAGYARYMLAVAAPSYDEARQLEDRALQAAINAALRAGPGAELARALDVLAEALERAGRGRDAIGALRLGLAEAADAARAAALERLLGLYGFRVIETQVDVEADFPRVCAVFSEPLAAGGVLYEDFVQSTIPGLAVEAEDRQVCLSGLRHGQRYEFTLRAGLPAASGEVLHAPVALRQYVRDRAPSVRFAGRAYILPAGAAATIPLVAVNTDLVDLRLFHVSDRNILRSLQEEFFGRPLADWQVDRFASEIGEAVWQGEAEVSRAQNRAVTTRLPLGEVLEGRAPGLYALEARVGGAGDSAGGATQWFLVSDLGVTAMTGTDGIHVLVRSLASTAARPGVSVEVISESNRVLARVETDADGYALVPASLIAGADGAAPALLTLRHGEEDLAFLSLREAEFDLSDRGVEGRAPSGPIDVFLATDRGAYRAGETIHLTALARDARAGSIEGLPLTAILTRADGVEYSRSLVADAGAGGHVASLPLGEDVPRGTWRLAIHADPEGPPLAETRILVEDFLAERLDMAIELAATEIVAGAVLSAGLRADYLFGAPAGGLPVTGRLALRPVTGIPGYPGYAFGRHDAPPEPVFAGFGPIETDAEGRATLRIEPPVFEGTTQPGELTLVAEIAEASGRPVERSRTVTVLPSGVALGIRPLFDGTLPEGAEAEFDLIALQAEAPVAVRWTLNRVERRYQWYRQNGNWTWEPVTTRARIANGESLLSAEPQRLTLPLDWGTYELRVEQADGGFQISSVGFEAGWYGAGDGSDTPDALDVSLDAAAYRPGDTARLRIVPRQGGLAVVQVVADALIHMRLVEIGDDPVEIELPVTEDWGAGAYVTASLIRPLGSVSGPVPARALGLVHAAVDPGTRALQARLDLPGTMRPDGPLDVALHVAGARPGETIHATIAAVDLGVLNLTGFAAPDPQGHYFGQRRLGVAFRDVYGRLIDGRDGAEGRIRQGGDGSAGLRSGANPPTEDILARFSGPLVVGADGVARARFDIPAFNGTLRVMAIAWSPTGVGQAQGDVVIRDPVVLTASAPRFLAPGDRARLAIDLTHVEGPAGDVVIAVTGEEGLAPGASPAPVTLAEGGTARISLPLTASGASGPRRLRITATMPSGEVIARDLTIPVLVNDPITAETTRLSLAPGESFTLDAARLDGLRPETARITLSAGPLARFDAAGMLQALDLYPYGCTEQVTSRALPLLYLAALAEAAGLGTAADLELRIEAAIRSVLTNQSANGAFGLWRASAGDLWLDAYATDFLSRARAEGHSVPERAFQAALDNLANAVATAPDFETGGEGLAYALMVLAREGQASMGDLRYYADVRAGNFATPLALAQLGAALALYGDQPRADAMFRAGAALLRDTPPQTGAQDMGWRVDYGSRARDAAGLLALAAASGSEAVEIEALLSDAVSPVASASTQEAVWTLLAAQALLDGGAGTGLTLDGVPVDGPLVQGLAPGSSRPGVIVNRGPRDAVLTLTRFGHAPGATEQFGTGYRIDRRYMTLDGDAVDPAEVAHGTRLLVVLDVRRTGAPEGRVMVTDPLPAGFEIDNPNLLRSGDVRALDGVDFAYLPEMAEFRQDRFLAAVDMRGEDRLRLAYILRAVTPGDFHHPAASVEDMYRPTFRAQTASGRVTVAE